jgi:hypothetical protein
MINTGYNNFFTRPALSAVGLRPVLFPEKKLLSRARLLKR